MVGYCIWGLFPIYFKALDAIDDLEVLAYRIFFSFILLVCLILFWGQWKEFLRCFRNKAMLGALLISTLMITLNWGLFIYAVGIQQTKSASLGYYINPFVNVALGVVLLGERLKYLHRWALAFAALGVGWMIFQKFQIPWISLVLAFSFGMYGLVRKRSGITPLLGLAVETALVSPLALGYLLYRHQVAGLGVSTGTSTEVALLLGTGLLTTVPLFLFNFGALRIPYSMMGFLQFITPTLHFVCAIVVFGEPFSLHEWISFGFIWIGLGFFVAQAFAPRGVEFPTKGST